MTAPGSRTASSGSQAGDSAEERAPLLSHLLELRRVMLVSLATVLVFFFLIYFLCLNPLMALITEPVTGRGVGIIYTAVSEALTTKIKVALIFAVIASSPVLVWQVWGFIRPALYPKGRKTFCTVFFLMLALFLLGVVFCIFAVYSLALDFFLVQGEDLAVPMLSLDKYVSFLFGFILPFGIAFQLPLVLYLAVRSGLTTVDSLRAKRKYVILGVFVLAALLTPPDIISQIAMGIPLCLLYEAGILSAKTVRPAA